MIEELAETLVLCSTPYCLVKEYKKNAEVQRIGREATTQEISQEIEDRIRNLADPEQLIPIYALIVAMSIKSYSEIKEPLQKAARSNIDWIPLVVAYVLESVPQITTATARPKPLAPRTTETITAANDNTIEYIIPRDLTRKED